MLTFAMLVIVFVIDYKMQLIPDTVNVVLLLVGIANIVFAILTTNSSLITLDILGSELSYYTWLDYVIGGVVGGAIFLILALLAKIIYKKEGMGFGDIKLMTCLGFIFGVKSILVIAVISFFVAAIISIVLIAIKKKQIDSYIPFGPFIVIGTLAVMLFGANIFIDIYYAACSSLGTFVIDAIYSLIK